MNEEAKLHIRELIESRSRVNRVKYENAGAKFGLTKRQTKELVELILVEKSFEITKSEKTHVQKYRELVNLYDNQPNLSLRTSRTQMLNQYSTPAPIAYLASHFVLSDNPNALYFEPSAGNGLLTTAWPRSKTIVNEIAHERLQNLKSLGYKKVYDYDGSIDFGQNPNFKYKFEGIATNPPFGSKTNSNYGFKLKKLEHVMAANALQFLTDSGKASIIIGGHLEFNANGHVQGDADKLFMMYLKYNFNIVDVINIDSKKLYSRMGTGFNVRLILLSGRKPKKVLKPMLKNDLMPFQMKIISNFDELIKRVTLSKLKTTH